MSLLLVLQLFFPIASALAEGEIKVNSSILPPSNLDSQFVTPSEVKLTWSSVYQATGYNVYEIDDGQLNLLGTTKSTNYTIDDLSEGSYTYVVSTLSTEGESGPCAPVTVEVVYPEMAAPATLTYTFQNGNDLVLSWGSSQYAEKYSFYQIDSEGQSTLLSTVTSRTYKIANAPAGTYTYAVSSVNSKYGESTLSNPLQVVVEPPVMTAPTNLTYTITNGNDINLKWSAVTYANSYKVYQIIDGQKALKNTVTSTSATLSDMPMGDYVYEVYSYSDRFGESEKGSQIAVTLGEVTMAPPSGFTYTIKNVNDIVLSWKAVTNATGYKIYQIIENEKVLKSTVTGTSVTYSNMPSGAYVYEVHSYSDRFGESQEGSQVNVTLGDVTMAPPSNLTFNVKNGNDIVLTWATASNANSYKVYQIIDDQKVLKSTVTGTTVTYTNQPTGAYLFEVHSYSDRFGESQEGSQVTVTLGDVTMAPPGNFAYTIKNGNDIVLSWGSVTNANNYKVYQIIDGQKVLKSTLTGTTATYGNMPAGDYSYAVYSYSTRFGESAEGSQLTFTLALPTIQPPQNLVQTIKSATSFTLSWDAAAYANSYKVYQIIGGQKMLKSTVTGTSVTYSNMSPGEYSYEVHTVSTRFGESTEGSKLTFSHTGQTMQAPTNLTNTITNGNDITLKWTAASYATNYKVYQVIDGQAVLKSTVTSTSVTYTNQPAGDYDFVVKSFSTALGESPEGAETSVSLVLPTMTGPGNLAFKIQNGNNVVLTWTTVPYANSYKVYELVSGQEVLKTTVTTLSATIINVPAGDHTYVVHSVSTRFGESEEGSKISLNLDQQMMAAPGNLTHSISSGNNITLKWNTVTYATAYNIYQMIDGEKVLKSTVTDITTTYQNMPAGNYDFVVHSFSTRFGESPEGSQISFTLVFPTMQAPSNLTQSIANGNDITLRWGATTYTTNYKVYQIIDGQKVLKNTVTGTSATFTNMPAGDYSYEVHSNSTRFGESSQGSTVNFTLVWPVVQPPTLTAALFNANNLTFTWQTVPWANEYRLYEVIGSTRQLVYKGTALTYKVYNLTEETHYYEMTAYSTRFGESAPSKRLAEEIIYPVMQPPVASLKLTGSTSALISWSFVTYANGYNVYEIVDGVPVQLTKNLNNLSYTVSNLTYADHYYYVTSYSNSFGESDHSNTVIAKLIVDTTPPVTKANAPTEWTNQSPVEVTLSATDDVTGVAKTYYAVNDGSFAEGNSFTVNEEGTSKISFYSVDKAGNTEATQTIYVKIDKTAPVTKETHSESDTITLAATDEQSGVAKTWYSVNGADDVEGTTVTLEKEGVNKVSFYSMDVAGNKEEAQTVEVILDQTPPVTTADAPKTWSKEEVTVNLTATDASSGVTNTFYSVNGSSFVEGTTFMVDKEGVNKVSFYSVDKAGNQEQTQTIDVKIDRTAPITVSNAPTGWAQNDVKVSLTATDAGSGVAKTFYSINGAEFVEGTVLTLDKEGETKVSFYSIDQLGNLETEQSIVVKVDKTVPVTQSDAPVTWSKEDVTVNLKSSDEQSGVAKTFYSIDGAGKVEGTSFKIQGEGIHKIVFYSVDVAGNVESEKTVEVKIDKTAPVITMNFQDQYKLGDSVQLLYVAKDNLSGIASEKMTVFGPNETTGKVVENGTSIQLDKPGVYKVIVTVIDAAGLSTTIQKQFSVYLPATIEVTPKVIKGNKGVFTVRVDLPEGFSTQGFDLNTATLNGVKALASNNGYYNQAKLGQFKFERSDFTWTTTEIMVEFRGYVNGHLVIGSTIVKVQK
ncbi:OmpL47-type beta-barrel domain-containing protein [Brevibacillus choshinensis]|uniref:OmpL47-type beta-barrel domain-containing protein n=1 Tax=Brevibacillus choshinensis TaxID=54911 RepID=UPI002E1BE63E|nr:hypothetical protein [Brevibacillus choshinensis]